MIRLFSDKALARVSVLSTIGLLLDTAGL